MAEALMVSDPLDDGILKRLRSAEASARRWRWAALFAAAVALISGAALAAAAVALLRGARQSDERLLGTWQSDADRTVSEHLKARPGLSELKAGQEEWALRHNAGKRRFTYNQGGQYKMETNGATAYQGWEVVAKDTNSVVILLGTPSREFFRRVK
jgi:hypothetical protein